MRYLVTGAGPTSFIGNKLFQKLSKDEKITKLVGVSRKEKYSYSDHPDKKNKSILCDCHLESSQWVNRLILEYVPDVIFHFAGCPTVSSPAQQHWESNTQTTFNLLNTIEKKDVPTVFVLASSAVVEYNNSTYSASKLAAEALVEAYHNLGIVKGIVYRLVAVAGSFNTHGAVADIIRKAINDDEINLLSNSTKPYTFVDNVIDIIANTSCENVEYPYSPITISPPDGVSISYIVNEVQKYLHTNKNVNFSGTSWAGDSQVFQTIAKPHPDIQKKIPTSMEAIDMAIKQTLREQYGKGIK